MLQLLASRAPCEQREVYGLLYDLVTECVATGTDPSSPATCRPRVQPASILCSTNVHSMKGACVQFLEQQRKHRRQQLTCSARTSRSFTASETSTLLTSATVLTCRHRQSSSEHGMHLKGIEHGVPQNTVLTVLPSIQQEPDDSLVPAMSLCKDSPWTCTSLRLQDCL